MESAHQQNPIFRRVNTNDPDELKFIAEQDSKIPLLYDPAYIWSEQSIQAQLLKYQQQIQPDDFFEVAVIEAQIIGFHILKKVSYPPNLFAAAIFSLWVAPAYRGRKLGSQLKSRGEGWAREQECSYIVTNVHIQNTQMLALNKSTGFEVIQYALRKQLTPLLFL